DELHPQLLDLVHDLELQLVVVAQRTEGLLARKQRPRVEIELVVEAAAAGHLRVELLSFHIRHLTLRLRLASGCQSRMEQWTKGRHAESEHCPRVDCQKGLA